MILSQQSSAGLQHIDLASGGEGIPEIQLSWRAPRPSTVSLLDFIVVHLNRPKSPASTAWTFSLAISGGPPPRKVWNPWLAWATTGRNACQDHLRECSRRASL